MFGLKHAGIGRYVENLILNILTIDVTNEYILFVRKNDYENIKTQVSNINQVKKPQVIIAEARHYSVKEQFLMPCLLLRNKLDLVHFPHFNVPLICPTKFVVTIHDLLWHEMRGPEVTTLSGPIYYLKYSGYKSVFAQAVKNSEKIFVPSQWIKNRLLKTYPLKESKIIVTFEGVDNKYLTNFRQSVTDQDVLEKYNLQKPYLIYTGSAYPHKNLNLLIGTIKILNGNSPEKIHLAIACARDIFWERLSEKIRKENLEEYVKLLGFVPDEDLKILYKNSLAFIFPSLSEGFGLPGLEAMASGAPVIASYNGALEEIYQNSALFFHPGNVEEIVEKIELVKNDKLRKQMIQRGYSLVKSYGFGKMARETLKGYQSVFNQK